MLAFMKMLDAGGTTTYPAETPRACRIETARDIKRVRLGHGARIRSFI